MQPCPNRREKLKRVRTLFAKAYSQNVGPLPEEHLRWNIACAYLLIISNWVPSNLWILVRKCLTYLSWQILFLSYPSVVESRIKPKWEVNISIADIRPQYQRVSKTASLVSHLNFTSFWPRIFMGLTPLMMMFPSFYMYNIKTWTRRSGCSSCAQSCPIEP